MKIVCGFILAAVSCQCIAYGDNYVTIGVIANGTGVIETESFLKHDRAFKIVKHLVDATDVYGIFRSVQSLDIDTQIDVIMLADYDLTVLMTPQILSTQYKKLIKMGVTNTFTREKVQFSDKYNPETSSEDPYCIMNLNITKAERDDVVLKMPGPQAMRSIIKTLKWSLIIVFYESSTEVETSALVDGLSKDGVLFALFNTEHVNDIQTLLLDIYQRRPNKETDLMIVIANKVDSLDNSKTLLKKFSRWLILVYDSSRKASQILKNCASDLDNVAIIVVPEFKTNGIESISHIVEHSVWTVLRTQVNVNSHADFKKNFIDEFQKNVHTWNPWSRCRAYYIDTLLWTVNGRDFSSVGYADISGNVVLKSEIFPNTKYGYNQMKFLVSTLEYAPFVIKRKFNKTNIYEGFCMDLLNELASKLNFTYELTEPADEKWGSYDENLTFNGLVGQLQREEVDIVAAPISNQAVRSKIMDFSYSYYYEYTTVVVKKPDANAAKWRTLINPFKSEVLVAIGVSLVTVTMLVFLLEKYNPFYRVPQNAETRMTNGGLHTWHNSFWYVYGALFYQGGVHLPESTSGRTLLSFWWLTCIIIVGIYSGNLIAFLTVTKERPPFNTLQELLELKGTYKWGTLGGTAWVKEFPTSSNPTFRAIGEAFHEFNKKDPTILHLDPDFHLQRVKEEKYAWIGDRSYIDNSLAKECSLMSIKEEFMPLILVFGFKKNSPHTAVFSEQMIKIQESGLLQIWKRKWWVPNLCAENTGPKAKPISLMDVQSAFYVCLIGVFLGSVIFLIEIILYKCRTYSKPCDTNTGTSSEIHSNESSDTEISSPGAH